MCVGRCGVYTENNGPVPILSGFGLDVEDDDHNEVFLMQVKTNLFFAIKFYSRNCREL